jgi:hypothetical protein
MPFRETIAAYSENRTKSIIHFVIKIQSYRVLKHICTYS